MLQTHENENRHQSRRREAVERSKYLDPHGMQEEYGFVRGTLANDRSAGVGIPFIRAGRGGRKILYARADVEKYLEERKVQTADSVR